MSTSTTSGCFRKGARFDIRVEKPLDPASGRLRVAGKHVEAGTVLGLFPLDEGLAEDTAHAFADDIVREAGRAARPANTARHQLKRSKPKAFAQLFLAESRCGHVARIYHVAGHLSSIRHFLGEDAMV